jgi:endonuclease/exonuclease/phosphatase family metal-dependent hydrolase
MRLLSYNIHKGIGGVDRRYVLDRILRVVEEQDPDLICLQEVTSNAPRTKFHDQPDMLAERLQPRDLCFQMNVRYKKGGYGNLVLSRFAFQQQRHVCLRMRKRKPRGAQVVVVETPQGPLQLTNWHLGLGERERHWQVTRLLEHTDFCNSAEMPRLIVGDFNDWRNTLAAGPFLQHGFHHVTSPPRQFRSFPAFMPTLALDKAFHRGGVAIKSVRLVRSRHTFWASDHLPLVIDFSLEPPKAAPKSQKSA